MKKIAVFASGNGSNFEAIAQSIQQKELNAIIALVVCDKKTAPVISKAQKREIPVFVFDAKEYPSKQAYEKEILNACKEHEIDFIVLAGYMRLISSVLLDAYPNQVINIHPSLLPSFKGKEAILQAVNYGVKVMGVTTHYVDQGMDTGRIIAQRAFEVNDSMDINQIETKIHQIEHKLIVETLQQVLEEYK